jgi:hypothetical protein
VIGLIACFVAIGYCKGAIKHLERKQNMARPMTPGSTSVPAGSQT